MEEKEGPIVLNSTIDELVRLGANRIEVVQRLGRIRQYEFTELCFRPDDLVKPTIPYTAERHAHLAAGCQFCTELLKIRPPQFRNLLPI